MSRNKQSPRDLTIAIGGKLESRKAWLRRVARIADVSFWEARKALYGDPVSVQVIERLEAAADAREQQRILDAADDLDTVADALAPLHRTVADLCRDAAREVRRVVRARPEPAE